MPQRFHGGGCGRRERISFDILHNTRRRHEEWMDRDSVDPGELRRALRYIRLVNRCLGYTRSIIAHLDRFSRSWAPGQRIDILDLATGSADIPRAILRWAERRNLNIHIIAVDRHPITTAIAQRESAFGESVTENRLHIVQADVFDLPFAAGSFDYVLCALFLHHLSEDQIVQVLRTMQRLSRRAIIAADLIRSRRAYFWISLLTLFGSRMISHDARASVAQSLTKREVLSLASRAGLPNPQYHRHPAHRFTMTTSGRLAADTRPVAST